jgi:hypothetical protein
MRWEEQVEAKGCVAEEGNEGREAAQKTSGMRESRAHNDQKSWAA